MPRKNPAVRNSPYGSNRRTTGTRHPLYHENRYNVPSALPHFLLFFYPLRFRGKRVSEESRGGEDVAGAMFLLLAAGRKSCGSGSLSFFRDVCGQKIIGHGEKKHGACFRRTFCVASLVCACLSRKASCALPEVKSNAKCTENSTAFLIVFDYFLKAITTKKEKGPAADLRQQQIPFAHK